MVLGNDSSSAGATRAEGRRALSTRHALTLGLLHGPAELLPISSSGHVTLVPWLAGWPSTQPDPQTRKSFEVALHAGTAAALLAVRPPSARLRFLAAAAAPPALVGYALHDRIAQRLGTPATIAAGLLAGSLATVAGELGARSRGLDRDVEEVGVVDGLAVGVAQAAALAPGVSRSASAFAAARARGFAPADAERLSLAAGLPVLCGAALLEASRSLARGMPSRVRAPLVFGAGAALLSTLGASRLLDERRRSRLALPAAAYRAWLAWLVLARLRSEPSP